MASEWEKTRAALELRRIVCGVDGSSEALEAARQAGRLAGDEGSVELVSVFESADVLFRETGAALEEAKRERRAELQAALDRARAEAGRHAHASSELLEGEPVGLLVDAARRAEAQAIAVGPPGRGRAAGIALGAVATGVLHKAPQAVLVAREPGDPSRFPGAVVVGVDGSPYSLAALATAEALRRRLGATLRCVVAAGGKEVDVEAEAAARKAAREVVRDGRSPVEALTDDALAADLLVVGSRGLHGPRALGSVSERVAHRAPCSVLVVRGEPPGRVAPEQVHVRDLMVSPAAVVRADATLEDAARIMLEQHVGGLPVVDARGELVGMLTESDFVGERASLHPRYGKSVKQPRVFGRWLLHGELERLHEKSRSLPVSEAMSSPVVTATEDEPLQAAVERMVRHDVNRVPVVRGRRVVGVVSRHDVLRLMAAG